MNASHAQWMFWAHEWEARSVRHSTHEEKGTLDTIVVSYPITRVLHVCKCGKAKTVDLRGTWMLEEVQP